jgi:hypothetical protein
MSMSVVLGIVLSMPMSAGARSADIPGQSRQESTTTRASKVIAYAKQLDVSRLDPTLPKRPLDQWMRDSGAPANATRWDFVPTCDLKGADASTPPCVQFTILHGNAAVRGLIQVGTQGEGMTAEPPLLLGLYFMTGSAVQYKGTESAKKLSELPRLVARLKPSKH